MLTISEAGRVFDFTHVVGGRQITGVVSLAIGEDNVVYIVKKAALATDVQRLFIGTEPGDEEITATFSELNEGLFEDSWPACVAIGPDQNVYVTDELKSDIMMFDKDGHFIRRIGEAGSGNGQFDRPSGITFDSSGHMYVADTMNNRLQKLEASGQFIAAWGKYGFEPGEFQSPWGITTDDSGSVYVADHGNHRVQKFSPEGLFMTSFGRHGSGPGEFDHPSDVAVDTTGDIYVCDWVNNRVQVFDLHGKYVTELAGSAHELSKWQKRYVEGNPDVAKARRRVPSVEAEMPFALPTGLGFDRVRSRLMVVDSQRWRIQIFDRLEGYSDPQFNI